MADNTQLILGFTGGIGRAVAQALSDQNIPMRVLVRSAEKASKYTSGLKNIDVLEGDASNEADLDRAFQGVSIAHYCINVPYQNWEAQALRLLKKSVDAATRHKVKFVFPGNVYVYGHAKYNPVDEKHPHAAHTKKGQIRMEMEEMLALAKKDDGLRYTTVRMPDFYGPFVVNGFSEQLFVSAIKGKTLRWVGKLDVPVELIYINDGGKAMVAAALSDKSDGEVFNIPGHSETTARKYLQEIVSTAGTKSRLSTMNSDFVFKAIGIFMPVLKELVEMLYLKREKLILSGEKYTKVIGPLPSTTYSEGIKQTIAWAKDFYKL